MYCNKWVGNAFSENGQKNVRIKESLLREWNRMRKRLVEWIKEKLVVGSAIKHTYIPSYPSISIWNELKISWPFFFKCAISELNERRRRRGRENTNCWTAGRTSARNNAKLETDKIRKNKTGKNAIYICSVSVFYIYKIRWTCAHSHTHMH